jgi:hypothetical protein
VKFRNFKRNVEKHRIKFIFYYYNNNNQTTCDHYHTFIRMNNKTKKKCKNFGFFFLQNYKILSYCYCCIKELSKPTQSTNFIVSTSTIFFFPIIYNFDNCCFCPPTTIIFAISIILFTYPHSLSYHDKIFINRLPITCVECASMMELLGSLI